MDRLDVTSLIEENTDSYEVLWDNEASYADNVINLIATTTFIPNPRLFIPITASYILTPSRPSQRLPILFAIGKRGSGKSEIGKIASVIRKRPIVNSAITYAALRNLIEQQRWVDRDYSAEKDTLIIWEDIDPIKLSANPDLYRMLKSGYDRRTDTIEIANKDGSNIKFRCFCPKVTSSITPIYTEPQFNELLRRVIPIPCKRLEEFTQQELQDSVDYLNLQNDVNDVNELLSYKLEVDNYNWDGIAFRFFEYWNTQENVIQFLNTRKILTGRNTIKYWRDANISSEQKTITIDILCSGLVLGIFEDIPAGIEHFGNYWEWFNEHIKQHSPLLSKLVKIFVDKELTVLKKLEIDGIYCDYEISPLKLKQYLESAIKDGNLDTYPSNKSLMMTMGELGWRLIPGKWILER